MSDVIDFFETDSVPAIKTMWDQVCGYFQKQPGFRAASLFETFETMPPAGDYALASFCQWDHRDSFQRARASLKADARLGKQIGQVPAKITAIELELAAGRGYRADREDGGVILIDVVRLDPGRVGGYEAMWERANAFLQEQTGYVDASLYRVLDPAHPVKFVNIGEWKNRETAYGALNTREFFTILGEYKDNLSLYFSHKDKFILSELNREEVV